MYALLIQCTINKFILTKCETFLLLTISFTKIRSSLTSVECLKFEVLVEVTEILLHVFEEYTYQQKQKHDRRTNRGMMDSDPLLHIVCRSEFEGVALV